ncbi:ABC transporter permease [Gryllotalpicola ginsengisoli]|uniref:ABC transporter permease n=1 Tax=Gryllotalpicola ginsengisoli TaxID=444608 RepID=UPI0003B34D5F|nr:ABC transporter permease [Gryllotalpicola ginsengisoli]
MSAVEASVRAEGRSSRWLGSVFAGNPGAVMSRSWLATRSTNWLVVASGFLEPVLYLLSLGVGLGTLIGTVDTGGRQVSYAAFIAPALLATSAMNGAVMDSTFNVFFKLNFGKLYEGMLATPLGPLDVALGEILMALLRGALYGLAFMGVMAAVGLTLSWTALLALPALLIIAFGFASLGMGVVSFMKTFTQLDWIFFVLLPMFLLSSTFFPITVYPPAVRIVIECLPLWHGIELVRGLTTGVITPALLWHVVYFAGMVAVGLVLATTRLKALFLK